LSGDIGGTVPANPTWGELQARHLVQIDISDIPRARANDWPIFDWDGTEFKPVAPSTHPVGTFYANIDWRLKRPPNEPPPPKTGTVTFMSQGGEPEASVSANVGAVIILPTPTYAGFTFNGWYSNAVGGVMLPGAYPVTGNSTLYAQWTAVSPPAPTVFTAAQTSSDQVTVSWSGFSPTEIARDGVDSTGTGAWNTGPLTDQPTAGTFTFNLLVPGDTYVFTISPTALTATLTLTGSETFTASFYTEPGTLVDSVSGVAGTEIPAASAPTSSGSTFNGWFTALSGGTLVTFPYTLEANVDFYAQWTTPPPPPDGAYPSGLTPPVVEAGFTRVGFDDFASTTISSLWAGSYNGQSKAAQDGIFLSTHFVLKGDSLLRLEAYSDPDWANSYESTAAIAASVNDVCGAGTQTNDRWAPPFTMSWACKWDTMPGLTPIVLTMGNVWPPEQDIIEAGGPAQGAPVTGFAESFLYAPGQQVQIHASDGDVDLSQWHSWQLVCTLEGSTVTCDGVQVGHQAFTAEMVSGANGLQQVQFLALQHQTGDAANPSAPIAQADAVTFYFDWVCIDVPA
jgi:uncharacterized repeat protein (TIGR02543 family)